MKTHVLIGSQVLKRTMETYKLTQTVFIVGFNIATYHHERYDGSGYPEGLKGDEIPLEGRIFALCDAYDAIRIKRPYKGEISHEEAVERILADKGRHFDPVVVDAFIQVESQFKSVSEEMK
jgi:response regulator RpfG family c-di-GMP phosphodiesterase